MFKQFALFAVVLTLAAPKASAADKMGLHLEVDFSDLVASGFRDLMATSGGADAMDLGPTSNLMIGYELGDFVPFVGIGFSRGSVETKIAGPFPSASTSLAALLLQLEGRYYLSRSRAVLRPYVYGNLGTSLVFADMGDATEVEEQMEDQLDFWNLGVGVGLEFVVAETFAVGGSWGIGGLFQSFTDRDAGGERDVSSNFFDTQARLHLGWIF